MAKKRFTRDDLLAEFDRVKTLVGKDPTWADLDRHATMSRPTFQNRIGNMPELRQEHRKWAEIRDKAAAGDVFAGHDLEENARANGTVLPKECEWMWPAEAVEAIKPPRKIYDAPVIH